MPTDDLCFAGAADLARRIRAGEVSPLEVVEAVLDRIEKLNDRLNLFCFVYPEEALEAARRSEQALQRGEVAGPLHGVPYAVKDDTPTAGKRTTLGSYAYERWVPQADAPVAERLAAAGGILVGKTTTPEFAHSSFTHSPLWGVSRNPWDPERTPGGSSGGSAGAVAAGMVPLATGSDSGGSVRIPAALSGVFGLKPSTGRIPTHIMDTDVEPILHVGALTRSVADGLLAFSVLHGPDERDPLSLMERLEVPGEFPPDLTGLRVAVSLDLGYYALDPDVEQLAREAVGALERLGAHVEPVELGWSREVNDAWDDYWAVLLATMYGDRVDDRTDPEVRRRVEHGRSLSAVHLKRIDLVRTRQWRTLRPLLERHDALVCCTTAVTAPPAGGRDRHFGEDTADGRFAGLDLTCPFNFVGWCPAASVPAGFTPDGLPAGLQIVGRRYDDLTVLRIAAAYETARPWTGRRPV